MKEGVEAREKPQKENTPIPYKMQGFFKKNKNLRQG
jgi:hypothetical protein